jgi:hypothetical protein
MTTMILSDYTFEELKWDEVPILIFKVLPIYRFEEWDFVPFQIFNGLLLQTQYPTHFPIYDYIVNYHSTLGRCYGTMLRDDATGRCYGTMLRDDATGRCYGTMLRGNATGRCYGVMLCYDATGRCYGVMLCYDATG